MTEAELITAQRKQIEELQNQLLAKKTQGEGMLNNMSEMFKGMGDKMKPIFEQLEKSKAFAALKPLHLKSMAINKKKCEVSVSETGIITIVFADQKDGFNHYAKLTK